LHLLIALCLGALASFSIAPHFLAQTPHKSPVTSASSDGECQAKPQDIKYLQQPAKDEPSLPPLWSSTGKSRHDFDLAQACATAFAIAYESFNINQPQSLTNATQMLSADGKKHFFQGTAAEPKDIHADIIWQAQARKEQLQQSAQALDQAQLQAVNQGSTLAVLFTVTYKLTTKIYGKSSAQQKQLLVFVEAIPTAPSGQAPTASTNASTGWRVVDWHVLTTSPA
jgi:hypothetical protein